MSKKFTTDDRELVMQFLTVLHEWVQELKIEKRNALDVLQLQEGVIKLLYARLTGGEDMAAEDIIRSADTIFEETDESPEEGTGETETYPDEHEEGRVIDIASWVRPLKAPEDDDNDE